MWQEAISLPEGTTFLQPLSSDQNWCWPHSKEVHRQNRLNPKSTTDFNRFPFNNFTYCLTLFPKCFSSFPHGTCSLSVSRQYLALDGIYHPIWAAFPNNSTLRKCITKHRASASVTGFSPLWRYIPIDLYAVRRGKHFSRLQLGHRRCQITNLSSSRFTRRY